MSEEKLTEKLTMISSPDHGILRIVNSETGMAIRYDLQEHDFEKEKQIIKNGILRKVKKNQTINN
ncbi:hypothetical protein KDU71_07715 [Carboxylicivirga sediminis]|uniref:Uncharacterized protein n=1 Tax=Carboxylicivirga sediminis TaxID=2006564 RepID=A0A941F325_9BACT|nr:hypothetical protein [Carboxylicivirga sediminis]MBR8535442.1 hypothetical protein [Carboxylicivirga sediminis]